MDSTFEPGRVFSAARAHLDRGLRFEQGGTLERALDAYRDAIAANASPREQAEALLRIARVHRTRAEWALSRQQSAEAVRIALAEGDDDLAAEAMNVEVGSLQMQGAFREAEAVAEQALARATSDRVRGITLQNLGRGAAELRDFERSDRYFRESVAAFRAANYDVGLSIALANAARAALDRGDVQASIAMGEEAIAVARRLNALDVLLTAVQNQAAAFVELKQVDSAELLLTEALGHFTSARNPMRQAECLEIMGQLSEQKADAETAVRCYARGLELAESAGDQPLIDRLRSRRATLLESRDGSS